MPLRRSTTRGLSRAAGLLLALFTLGCQSRERAAEGRTPPNILLVLVDTLRADHLGIYGYSRDTSPHLDLFARNSLVFENARSQASCTAPSVNSLLTSRYPFVFLDQPRLHFGIPGHIPTVAEILGENGYTTAAVSASPVVRQTPSPRNPHAGFGAGFEIFDEECHWKPAECVNERAIPLLDTLEEPFFLYLHYMDPHGPYRPPAHFERKFASSGYSKHPFIARGDPNPIEAMLYSEGEKVSLGPGDWQHLIDLYDDEIAYFDEQFLALWGAIALRELDERSLVVFLSDHGEAFFEHGHVKHCRGLFDPLIKTPLILHLPDAAPRRFDQAVQNVDVVPTLLDYAAIPSHELEPEGRSLRPLIESGRGEPLPGFALQNAQRAVFTQRYKLIRNPWNDRRKLFDLELDPGETENLAARLPGVLSELDAELARWIESQEGGLATERNLEVSGELLETLRALGYLE